MTVHLVISQPNIPYIHRICMVLANPNLYALSGAELRHSNDEGGAQSCPTMAGIKAHFSRNKSCSICAPQWVHICCECSGRAYAVLCAPQCCVMRTSVLCYAHLSAVLCAPQCCVMHTSVGVMRTSVGAMHTSVLCYVHLSGCNAHLSAVLCAPQWVLCAPQRVLCAPQCCVMRTSVGVMRTSVQCYAHLSG